MGREKHVCCQPLEKGTLEMEDVNRTTCHIRNHRLKCCKNVSPVEETSERKNQIHMAAKRKKNRKAGVRSTGIEKEQLHDELSCTFSIHLSVTCT